MVITGLTRNQLAGNTAQGFESLTLRQKREPKGSLLLLNLLHKLFTINMYFYLVGEVMAKENKFAGLALSAIPDDELQKLDNQLCFSLYVSSKEVIRRYKPLLDPYDLTYTGYITLMALWEKDGVNVKELGKKLFLDSGTLTPLLKKLEAVGYVERKRDPKDERNMHVYLTERGVELKKEMVNLPKELLSSLPLGNVKTLLLVQTLHQFMEDLEKENERIDK